MSWFPSPEYADWWYDLSWKGIIGFGIVAAFATAATVVFTVLQFWSDGVRDEKAERRSKAIEVQLSDATARAAILNNETERLKGDNLALQTVLLPRHVGLIGLDSTPKVSEWFSGLDAFSGTKVSIQAALDPEAENLAQEVAIALTHFGWIPSVVSASATSVPPRFIIEGVRVSYPTGKPWTKDEQEQPWFAWARAAEALADALTKAGLGVGERRVSRYGFDPDDKAGVPGIVPRFNPPLDGVYVQIGSRPVAMTVDWIKSGRPDELGNIPANARDAPK